MTDPTLPTVELDRVAEMLEKSKHAISARFIGQRDMVDLTLAAILSGGHALLVGVPGLGKTRLVETFGTVMGLKTNRVQFTPDLMPADILGSEILQTEASGERRFKFVEGPVFTELLMADEINRASPRTQSALLQAMQERQVSIAGSDRPLAQPFHVLATQNPIEQEGTYPLPEAQLDRFLAQIDIDYPDRDTEQDILLATTGVSEEQASRIFDVPSLLSVQRLVRQMPVGDATLAMILALVRGLRPDDDTASELVKSSVNWGPGTRAAQSLILMSRAKALIEGRAAANIDDVLALAYPVLVHRMSLKFSARTQGISLRQVISETVTTLDREGLAA